MPYRYFSKHGSVPLEIRCRNPNGSACWLPDRHTTQTLSSRLAVYTITWLVKDKTGAKSPGLILDRQACVTLGIV